MVEILLSFSVVIYLLMAIHFFTLWLAVFRRDTSVSPEEELGALMILVIITIFWPLVVPLSYLELLNGRKTVVISWHTLSSNK